MKKRYRLKKEVKEDLINLVIDVFGVFAILLLIQLLILINLMVF